ncbi:MAG: D-alanine--D-alanine ligase [Anaerolineales bacterium]|nr:D-alanine--D-alanine ligase [Anaerolineales bacterium]
MSKKLRLGVLFGGRSGEHEVSLMSARSVIDALDKTKYEVIEIGISKEGHWLYGDGALRAFETGEHKSLQPVMLIPEPERTALIRQEIGESIEILKELDVIFPVLHGTFGEDGSMQGLFELAELPYVGAGVLASSVAMDKGLFKDVMRAQAIPVVDWIVLEASELQADLDGALKKAERLGDYPLFTKPANMGSSVGITRCKERSTLLEGLMEAAQYDRRILVEWGLDAREIEVSVLGNEDVQASVPGEIIPSDEFYSYKAKYIDDASKLRIPAEIDEETAKKAQQLAIQAYRAIDGAGMARVDFLLDKVTGKLYMNEINTIPGFTQISMYPKLWEASELPYVDLLDRLIELALMRHEQKSGLLRSYEGEGTP